jgi:hypothetical protein
LRASLPELRKGDLRHLHVGDQTYVYSRSINFRVWEAIVAINNADKAVEVECRTVLRPLMSTNLTIEVFGKRLGKNVGPQYVERLGSGAKIVDSLGDGTIRISLPPRSASIFNVVNRLQSK